MRFVGFLLALLGALLIALLITMGAAALISGALRGAEWLDTPTAFTLMLFALASIMIAVPLTRSLIERRRLKRRQSLDHSAEE